MLTRALLGFSLLLTACGPCPTPAHPEAPTEPPPVLGEGAGRLQAETAALAATLQGVDKMELELGTGGVIEAIAIYHHDAESIPAVVRQLAEQRFPGAQVRSYETEVYRDGGRVFEVEVTTSDGKTCEVSATPDGTLRYIECALPASELPPAVMATVTRTVPSGEIHEAERKTDAAGVERYSVEVRAGTVEHYLRIASDGSLTSHGLVRPATIEVPAP
jgi:hypothetical protein